MSGDIMCTWPIELIDPKAQVTNYEGKIIYEGRDFRHCRPQTIKTECLNEPRVIRKLIISQDNLRTWVIETDD